MCLQWSSALFKDVDTRDKLLLVPVDAGCMDLKRRVNLLTKTALGLGVLGLWMVLLSFYVSASGMLGERSAAAAGWLFNVAVELMGIATLITLYIAAYVSPATMDDE
jgi:hypothetical protein